MHSAKNIKEVCPVEKCTGCSACFNACRHHAIKMTEDLYGHVHPVIDVHKCVGCNLCEKSCPVINKPLLLYPRSCFAMALPAENDLALSASGGAATALMRQAVNENGVVYGCSGEDVYHVRHVRVDNLKDIEKLRGSKYVQSEIGLIYKDVLSDLKSGKLVFFTGTPCQVAGLKTFLRKDYPNLVTVDLVCHGVPSQKMLTENIGYYTDETDGKKIKIAFRSKSVCCDTKTKLNSCRIEYGWYFQHQPYSSFARKFYDDSYMFAFLQCLTFRESCYTCRYATSARCSDITLADFWGLGDDARYEKGRGVSLCLINTEKGLSFFGKIKDKNNVVEREIVEAIVGNGQLQCPSAKSCRQEEFRALYPKLGLKMSIAKVLMKEKFGLKVLQPLKQTIKDVMRR